jgi:hypothetical protein
VGSGSDSTTRHILRGMTSCCNTPNACRSKANVSLQCKI